MHKMKQKQGLCLLESGSSRRTLIEAIVRKSEDILIIDIFEPLGVTGASPTDQLFQHLHWIRHLEDRLPLKPVTLRHYPLHPLKQLLRNPMIHQLCTTQSSVSVCRILYIIRKKKLPHRVVFISYLKEAPRLAAIGDLGHHPCPFLPVQL